MFKWLKNKYLDHLYYSYFYQLINDLIEIYPNTWDKQRVRRMLRMLIAINKRAYSKDILLKDKVETILRDERYAYFK